jgi:hypothetical protein
LRGRGRIPTGRRPTGVEVESSSSVPATPGSRLPAGSPWSPGCPPDRAHHWLPGVGSGLRWDDGSGGGHVRSADRVGPDCLFHHAVRPRDSPGRTACPQTSPTPSSLLRIPPPRDGRSCRRERQTRILQGR